jgi:hypothetical protein
MSAEPENPRPQQKILRWLSDWTLFSGAAICFQELKEEREFAAQAAVMPVPAVLEILKNSGIERLIDFFERDAAGSFHVADRCKIKSTRIATRRAALRR